MVRARKVYKIYRSQVQQQLYVSNSHWGIKDLIFCYYHPEGTLYKDNKNSKERLIKLVILPAKLDIDFCKKIERTVNNFWKMVDNNKWEEKWKENGK